MNNQLSPLKPPLDQDHIQRLFDAQQNATGKNFEHIFGTELGQHLFGKYSSYFGSNLVLFLQNIGPRNQALFLHWLNGGN